MRGRGGACSLADEEKELASIAQAPATALRVTGDLASVQLGRTPNRWEVLSDTL